MSDGTSFTIEKAARYFEPESRPKNYHSIIFNDQKINHEKFRQKREVHHEDDDDSHDGCGLTKSLKNEMEELQNAGEGPYLNEYTQEEEELVSHLSPRHRDSYFDELAANYSRLRNKELLKPREKRNLKFSNFQDINGKRLYSVRTCSIYMQADQKLYEHVFGKEGNNDPVRTREEIVALFYNHIKAVNQIYESTNFGGITGLNFVIQRTTVGFYF